MSLHCLVAALSGESSLSRAGLLLAPAYSLRALPSGSCWRRPLLLRPDAYDAMKANGYSGSLLFSARCRVTRPTRDQSGACVASKLVRSVLRRGAKEEVRE